MIFDVVYFILFLILGAWTALRVRSEWDQVIRYIVLQLNYYLGHIHIIPFLLGKKTSDFFVIALLWNLCVMPFAFNVYRRP